MQTSDFYKLLKKQPLEELSATLYLYEHLSSGAKLMHLQNEDPENVFCLSLSTYPTNSCGVAHILEHMALCGSKKYPVKDPFFSMIRRSLNTFMNAFTGSDFTCYPAASQNAKDFYNLLDVYIDAVFFPHLDKRSFLQEGHRLEWKDPQNSEQLARAGIVYNEMKGAYVNPDTHLWKRLHEQLLDETCYRFDSGGDPKEIFKLSHEQLCAFHQRHYHPSHCLFFFYGNLPTASHANFLHERLLKDIRRADPLEKRALQTRWSKPRTFEASYPGGTSQEGDEALASRPMAAIAWLTGSIQDTRLILLLELIDYLLMGHDGAPLKRFFLESGLCHHASSHVETEMLEIPYALMFKDCQVSSLKQLEEATLGQLKSIHAQGFSKEAIESALHQLKLSRLEISAGGYPFGLTLFFRAGLCLQQGGDPLDALKLHEHFDSLKHLSEEPSELLETLKKFLIDNPHRLDLWLTPDPTWAEKASLEEKKELLALEKSLSSEDKRAITEQSKQLQQEQEKEENKELLPKIAIGEIDEDSQHFPLEKKGAFAIHDCFTNGFVYADVYLQFSRELANSLNLEQWHDLKLLAYLWPRLGAAGQTYSERLERFDLSSSGLGCSLQLVNRPGEKNSSQEALAHLVFSISGLSEKSGDFLPLLEESIRSLRLDETRRIEQLIDALHSSLENQLPAQALQYATSIANSALNPYCGFLDWAGGLAFVHYVAKVALELKHSPSTFLERLSKLREKLLTSCSCAITLSGKKEDSEAAQKILEPFQSKWPAFEGPQTRLFKIPQTPRQDAIAYEINSQVSFNAISLSGPALQDPEAMAARLGCELIKQQVLHVEIREKGGAYGYGCSWSADKQSVTFHSYRDPHIKRTLEVFQEGAERIAKGLFTLEELDEAKRCWIQRLDKPIPPGERATAGYGWELSGLDLALRNKLRRELLACTQEQVALGVKKWLADRWSEHCVCLFGPAKQIAQETSYQATHPLKGSNNPVLETL